MLVQKIPISKINPAPYNPRKDLKPGDDEYERLKKSIKEFDLVEPLIWNKRTGNLVGGHQRLKIMKNEMNAQEADVSVVDLDVKKEKALNVALNKISGEWDFPKLKELLVELDDGSFDLSLTGFDEIELKDLIDYGTEGKDDLNKDDTIPDIPKDPVTKPGDIYALGNHRLICGDCRNKNDMIRLFVNEKANVVVTSPPYASQRKYDESSGFKPIRPDDYVKWFDAVQNNIGEFLESDASFFLNIKEHCEDGERHLYVNDLVATCAREWGWKFIDEFAWVHGGTPKAVVRRFKNGWEPIFQFSRGLDFKFRPDEVRHESDSIPDFGGRHPSQDDGLGMQKHRVGSNMAAAQGKINVMPKGIPGLAYPANVLSLGKNHEALGHGAAYPVSLPEFFIKAYSDELDIVFDPFMGSGSTLIAAEKINRRSFGTEISPAYCDVIVKRWEDFTGKKAELLKEKVAA